MVRPPVATKLFLGLYSLFYSCTIALDALVDSVTITDQRVPGAVLNGTEYVVLDCVYRVKPDATEGLVITWYFNNSPSPAYQWIPGQPPRTIGPLRGRIRLDYAAPTDDALAKYRALYIVRPTIELTGNYKCVVSTYNDEDFMIKKMTVYAPGKHMHMRLSKTNDQDVVNISCTVSRVFPLPKLSLYKLDTNGTENRNRTLDTTSVDFLNDGAFDVTTWILFSESELPSRTVFFCELIIPNTPYNMTKRYVYSPGNTESLSAGNNLYGWAMSQNMPCGGFKWYEGDPQVALSQLEEMNETDELGRLFEIDISYPRELHDAHNDLPFLPHASVPPGSNVKKLMATFETKYNYVIHYINLKQAISNGLVVDKVHRVLEFKQRPFLAPYINLNTEMRQKATNEFEKDFFKLMNNAMFGKTMESMRKRQKVELVCSPVRMQKLINSPTFKDCISYNENLVLVSMHKTEIEFSKPIYVGQAVLDLSKKLMYDYHYDVMKKHYKHDIELMYTDTENVAWSSKLSQLLQWTTVAVWLSVVIPN